MLAVHQTYFFHPCFVSVKGQCLFLKERLELKVSAKTVPTVENVK
jgi:hypothetical protein